MAIPKKILILSAGGGDEMTPSLREGFQALGHTAEVFFDRSRNFSQNMSLLTFRLSARTPFDSLTLRHHMAFKKKCGAAYEQKIRSSKPDLVIMLNFNSIDAMTVRKVVRTLKIPVAYLVIADPLFASKYDPYYIDTMIECSHLLFINGSAMQSMRLLTDAKFSYLPLAADPKFYKPLGTKKDLDIVMVGQFSAVSVSAVTKGYLLNELCKAGFHVATAGAGITALQKKYPHLKNLSIIKDAFLPIEEINEIYNRAKIVLAPQHPRDKDSISLRAFEAALAGSFALADYQSDNDRLFEGSVISFTSSDDLIKKSRYYLDHDEERERLAKKAHEITLKQHTYRNRAQEILAAVFA